MYLICWLYVFKLYNIFIFLVFLKYKKNNLLYNKDYIYIILYLVYINLNNIIVNKLYFVVFIIGVENKLKYFGLYWYIINFFFLKMIKVKLFV